MVFHVEVHNLLLVQLCNVFREFAIPLLCHQEPFATMICVESARATLTALACREQITNHALLLIVAILQVPAIPTQAIALYPCKWMVQAVLHHLLLGANCLIALPEFVQQIARKQVYAETASKKKENSVTWVILLTQLKCVAQTARYLQMALLARLITTLALMMCAIQMDNAHILKIHRCLDAPPTTQ